jgi:glutaredoxin 3
MMWTKSYCPYSKKAKELFQNEFPGVKDYKYIDIDQLPETTEIQDYLQQLTGARTVPRVFIGGKFVGGADDTVQLHKDGKLRPMLEQAGAL